MSNSLAITVDEKNRDKIDAAITAVEGRAKSRCATYWDVARAVAVAEQRLAVLPKSLWDGATCTYDDTTVPNSYSYRAESTAVTVQRKGSRWVFVGAERVPTKTRSYSKRSEASFAQVTLGEASPLDLLSGLLNKAGLTMAAGTRGQLVGTDI